MIHIMSERGFSELFGGPPKEVVRAKKPTPVPGAAGGGSESKKRSFWRPFRLLDPNLPMENVPKQGMRNVAAPIVLTDEEHRADLRRADIQKRIIKLQEKFAKEGEENRRAKIMEEIVKLQIKL